MASRETAGASRDSSSTKKRKDPPIPSSDLLKKQNGRAKRTKVSIARTILTQSTDAALKNGELDLQSFLKSREFEIKALEDGMRNSKNSLHLRAFQQVPRDMRRRTASHNIKRVPKRMQNRARREQIQDNTPTVLASKRKPKTSRSRLRAENAKRLGILAAKRKTSKCTGGVNTDSNITITTRVARPKLRTDKINEPLKPKSKFRKRQIHKTWLPTHLWHAKRAHMTEPKMPLWRFSIPLRCTEKSYRPTHRAGAVRGALVWDMSYMSTISLEGSPESLEIVLKTLGVTDGRLWEQKNNRWISGRRSWDGWLSRQVKEQRLLIGPSTIVWCSSEQGPLPSDAGSAPKKKLLRRLFIRIHPSIFLETWNEVLRLAKLQRPLVHATDLRFEIGSLELSGPGSTEALLGILHPSINKENVHNIHGETFKSLVGVTNSGSLPANALLSFSVEDPRLKYPPRKISIPNPTDEDSNFAILEMLSTWPVDSSTPSPALFDRERRFKASRLPSQKAINRRKSLAPPGSYPSALETDPEIPVVLLASRKASNSSSQGCWTLLAPWKCILPIWYGLVHYPLSSGGNPRFGGIQEYRQVHFEHGVPWFPADFPGTEAGSAWEMQERGRRKREWDRRPKGKRIEWDSLDLGAKRKGEVGRGWACDFEKLIGKTPLEPEKLVESVVETPEKNGQSPSASIPLQHVPTKEFVSLLSSVDADLPQQNAVATIKLTLITRGVAAPCARIYRLPADAISTEEVSGACKTSNREQWLALLPATQLHPKAPKTAISKLQKPNGRIPINTPLPQRIQLLAKSLLERPLPYPADETEESGYPSVPDEEDLIGFVTTGEFNLAEGKGIAVGSVLIARTIEGFRRNRELSAKEGRLCIVRNTGEKVGRLACWEPV